MDRFRRDRRNPQLDWTTLHVREQMAVFVPVDVAPQEVRDCLQEEIAQALGPLNDLYHLTDSVFNDDNFHTILTGFDMLVLRATYAPELRSGMSKEEVAARLPAILARLNPRAKAWASRPARPRRATGSTPSRPRSARGTSPGRRVSAAAEAVEIARARGWNDNRTAFSLYALGRLSLRDEPRPRARLLPAGGPDLRARSDTQIHEAHISMQLAAFALSAGQADLALELTDRAIPVVERAAERRAPRLAPSRQGRSARPPRPPGRGAGGPGRQPRLGALWLRPRRGRDALRAGRNREPARPVRGEPS